MTLSGDIYTICSGDTTLTNLVDDRIYYSRQVTSTFPQVVYSGSTGFDDQKYRDHDGAPGRAEILVQFDCYGTTANEAEQVANAIVDLWSGYQSSSPDVGRAHIMNQIEDGYSASLEAFRLIVDVVIETSV